MKESGYAEVSGARFYYEVAGQGDPVVFVHAGIADRRMWDAQFDAFARQYRALRYDRRGFGNTAMVAGTFSHRRDLHALLDSWRSKTPIWWVRTGREDYHRLRGGHPQMPRALVVVSPRA